jgi:hypothetical protein
MPRNSPPNRENTTEPMILRIINAGIEAMEAFTMNVTIDQKGILISVMVIWVVVLLSMGFSWCSC